jgi:tryptophan synthase beta chain
MHQTIIGQECLKQMEYSGDYPDVIIAPLGGGSNFAGISFPFLHQNIVNGKKTRFVAVEPASCPKLTKGVFKYDFGDTAGYTPLLPMYTLGHNFRPASIHAGGLRYHGASVLCSQLLRDGLIEAQALQQLECFEAGIKFARAEGIIPAPEATHGIAQVIREAELAKKEGVAKTILFNLCGHGFVDMQAYADYFEGKLSDHFFTDAELTVNLAEIEALQPA